ncbi:MAG: DNA primase [Parachlamydiales bacterium]|nr:DNA primase [Parachlamydiales bacterium]
MRSFTKESLELLRSRIDLVEVMTPHVHFTKSGIYYKSLCPFHEEKTPSFVIQRGDSHYHCFGCGAHGDAISFLMNFQKLSFQDAVEHLADKFGVHLEFFNENEKNYKGPSKSLLKAALEEAKRFFLFFLINTKEGEEALEYLYKRGIDLDFIKTFEIGLSPKRPFVFQKYMHEKKISKEILIQTGLLKNYESPKDFFQNRIMIPIKDAFGSVIGFTARKYQEDTFGGKYINTPETVLFKKSKILFGLDYSRKNIAKQKKAIIVEGQIDCLRLIKEGFSITVASQGTAFTEDHVKELINLGVKEVFLAMDSDSAGIQAAIKTGDLFQKEAIESYVVDMQGLDPDAILIEKGPNFFEELLKNAKDYLTFLVEALSKNVNMSSPSQKNAVVQTIINKIKKWDHPLMVHESLRKLARLTSSPESILSLDKDFESKNVYIKKHSKISDIDVNFDLILETDLLRILFLHGASNARLIQIAKDNIQEKHFKITVCRNLFKKYLQSIEEGKVKDLLSFAIDLENVEERLFLSEMLQKKINQDKLEETFLKTTMEILQRYWMEKREEIKLKIHSSKCSDDELLELAKEFDEIKNNRPEIILPK